MVSPGKVEIGQGIVTALAQIAADELDVDIGRVQMVRASTVGSPNEGVTSGSLSVQHSGRAIRHACAEIRQIFLEPPPDRLGVDADVLEIKDGTMSGPGNVATSYWELAGEISLDRDATPGAIAEIIGATHACRQFVAAARHSRQGFRVARASFTIPLCPACCMAACCGRNFRARNSSNLSEDGARAVAGLVAIVRDGNFAGVVSETEDGAEAALAALRKGATWSSGETLPDEDELAEWLKRQPVEFDCHRQESRLAGCEKRARSGGNIAVPILRTARSRRPAPWRNGTAIACEVWTHSQGVYLPALRSRAGAQVAAREHHRRTYGGRRLLRPQRRRRRRARCSAAGEVRAEGGRYACSGRAPTRCRRRLLAPR